MWKIFVEPDRPQRTEWRMRIAYWIPESTNTHTECVILIVFPLQQWLHESAAMLRYKYIADVVINCVPNSDLCDSQLRYIVFHMTQFGSFSCHLCDAYMLPWKRHQNDISTAGDLGVVTGEAMAMILAALP
jgi:hypothetical protein